MIRLLTTWITLFLSFFYSEENTNQQWTNITQWDTVYQNEQVLSVKLQAYTTGKPNRGKLIVRHNQMVYQDSLTCSNFDLVAYDNCQKAQLVDVDEDGTLDWVYLFVLDCQSGTMASKKHLLYGNHKYLMPIKINGFGLDPATPWILEKEELIMEASDLENYQFPGKIEASHAFLNCSEIEKSNLMQLWQEDLEKEYAIFTQDP